MSPETRARPIHDGFKPIGDFGYNGRFPDAIEVNEKAIEGAFGTAGLDYCNGIIIEQMSQSDVERSRGRWVRHLFVTEKINDRWRIRINDEVMMERSEGKDPNKGHQENFTQELNGLLKKAVLECVSKEWRLDVQSEKFSSLALKPFEIFDKAKCSLFLYLGNGRTLVRQGK